MKATFEFAAALTSFEHQYSYVHRLMRRLFIQYNPSYMVIGVVINWQLRKREPRKGAINPSG